LLIVVGLLIQPADARKKGFVTIATIGPSPITVDAHAEPQQVIKQAIAHWFISTGIGGVSGL
jgi:hypothetical protein